MHNSLENNKKWNDIHSLDGFRLVLERERARANRNGHGFTLLSFDLSRHAGGSNTEHDLARALVSRVRSSDMVGWLDDCRISALLPDTPVEGAKKVAEHVCQITRQGELTLAYEVYAYPGSALRVEHRDLGIRRKIPASSKQGGRRKPDVSPEEYSHDARALSLENSYALTASYKDEVREFGPQLAKPTPIWKRTMDVTGAVLGLALLSPVFALVSLVVKVVSPGTVFHKQERIGHKGRGFTLWKFRTMKMDAESTIHEKHLENLIQEDKPMAKLDGQADPRIIPFGKFLRKTCLDELPQLINVLRGEMSLVGPRPCMPYEAQSFQLWQRRRFDVVPGMTGLWQVNGKNKTTFTEMMRLDLRYVVKRSFKLDLVILLKTFSTIFKLVAETILKRKDAENGESA